MGVEDQADWPMQSIVEKVGGLPLQPLAGSYRRSAAVALILSDLNPSEILLIERARVCGDPWSGQIALPGGRVECFDESDRAAAERETMEELGLVLPTSAYVGPLHEMAGRASGRTIDMKIACHVFTQDGRVPIRMNREVASFQWVPVSWFLERRNQLRFVPYPDNRQQYPGIKLPKGQILWGLTYRFMSVFFSALGEKLPE